MINVVCVKWGTKYSPVYVNKLKAMVDRNLSLPHKFICFTDDVSGLDEGVETRPLPDQSLAGWWNKLYLFSEEAGLDDVVFYLDLDVVITKNIDDYFTHLPNNSFVGTIDYSPHVQGFNSSVMRWKANTCTKVWLEYLRTREEDRDGYWKIGGKRYVGDQEWITDCLFPQPDSYKHSAFPYEWSVSYKRGGRKLAADQKGARIVVFHGEPNPHEVNHIWVRKHWRM